MAFPLNFVQYSEPAEFWDVHDVNNIMINSDSGTQIQVLRFRYSDSGTQIQVFRSSDSGTQKFRFRHLDSDI